MCVIGINPHLTLQLSPGPEDHPLDAVCALEKFQVGNFQGNVGTESLEFVLNFPWTNIKPIDKTSAVGISGPDSMEVLCHFISHILCGYSLT